MDWQFKIMRTHHLSLQIATKIPSSSKDLGCFEITLPGTNQFVLLRMDGWKSIVSILGWRLSVRCELLVSGWLACKASRHFPTVCQPCQEDNTFRNLRYHWPVFIIWMYMMYTPKLQVMLNFEKWSRFMSFPQKKNGSYHLYFEHQQID